MLTSKEKNNQAKSLKFNPEPFTLTPIIKELKAKYEKEGLVILGFFGSYARREEDVFSDIDIAYKIDHNKFFKDNAFKKLIRIEEIKRELELNLHKKVDMVSLNSNNERLNKTIKGEMVSI